MWPFSRRKPPATTPLPPLVAETWRVGDVAECIRDDWAVPAGARAPQRGARHIVAQVEVDVHAFVALIGYPSEDLWLGYGFRKIVLPDVATERDAGECLPSREAVDG